jgi:hypothetical protein
MAETTKGKKKIPSKRAVVMAVWEQIQRPDIPIDEFIRGALFLERNCPSWRRKPRRSNDEVAFDTIRELERQGLLRRMKGTQ